MLRITSSFAASLGTDSAKKWPWAYAASRGTRSLCAANAPLHAMCESAYESSARAQVFLRKILPRIGVARTRSMLESTVQWAHLGCPLGGSCGALVASQAPGGVGERCDRQRAVMMLLTSKRYVTPESVLLDRRPAY
jgi:hypothetical protein